MPKSTQQKNQHNTLPNSGAALFKGLTDWIEIFASGKQTDSKGRSRDWTDVELDKMVANHNTANPIPHTITHKKLFSPFAYAQGVELKREGNKLYVRSDNIEPQFEELVKKGRLYERSVGIRPAENGWKIDHIAWLGAEPPAVEGLAPVEFSADKELLEYVQHYSDFAIGSYTLGLVGRAFRNLRDWLIDKESLDTADRVIPDYFIDAIDDLADDEEATTLSEAGSNFSRTLSPDPSGNLDPEQPTPGETHVNDKTFTQADIDAAIETAKADAEAKFQTTQSELTQERQARRVNEFQAQINKAIDDGKLFPAQAEGMAEFMAALPADLDQPFEFSSGEGDKAKTVKQTPAEWFQAFIDGLSQRYDLTSESDAGWALETSTNKFTVADGYVADPEKAALHNKALDYQAAHPGVDYIQAVKAVDGGSL